MPLITPAEYARHRGCSRQSVHVAIKQGKIHRNASGKIDSEAADASWRNPKTEGGRLPAGFKPKFPSDALAEKLKSLPNSQARMDSFDIEDKPDEQGNAMESYMVAKTRRELANAELAEMKAKQLRNELIPIEEFKSRMEKMIVASKSKILGLPSLLKTQMPHLTNQDLKHIDKVLRDSLLELSETELT